MKGLLKTKQVRDSYITVQFFNMEGYSQKNQIKNQKSARVLRIVVSNALLPHFLLTCDYRMLVGYLGQLAPKI